MRRNLYCKAILIFVGLFSLSMGTLAQINVQKVDENIKISTTDGIFYSLPRTCLRIDLKVNKTEKIKGPYAEYAEKLLGLSQVTMSNSQEYDLESIAVSSFQEPDPDEFYFIQFKNEKSKERRQFEIFLSQSGVISSVNATNPVLKNKWETSLNVQDVSVPEIVSQNTYEKTDTVIRKISVDTSTFEQKLLRKISATKTPEQKAKEAADFILKLDESMYNLINGYQEVNYEKGTMEFMYKEMENLRNDYLQLFKGYSRKTVQEYSIVVIPVNKQGEYKQLAGKFSGQSGFSENEKAGGEPLVLKISSLETTSALTPVLKKMHDEPRPEKGLYYRIPEIAGIKIDLGNKTLFESRISINQFGKVAFLPASSFNNLEFFNATGGLKHIILQ